MASDTSLVFNLVARERVSAVLEQVKAKFARAGAGMGKGLAAGFGVAAGSGITAAAAGVAAGAVAAGLAVKAFSVAAGPQLESVGDAWEQYDKSQDPAIKGTAAATEATKKYKAILAGMPPATRDTAQAFVALKKDFSSWSDELSGTTMPVFTKGIGILRDMLPTLTPFVRAAAGAIGGFLDDVSTGVKSAGFKQWAADMSAAAGPALSNFLTVIKNLAVGFGGLLQAFLPVSSGMTGGLVSMSAAFASWGANLQHTEGFARFLELASNGGGALGNLASAAGNLLVALSPLIGTTAILANALARVISATPTPVLTALAGVLLTVKVGMMAYSAVTAIITARNAIMAASMTPVILGWLRMNAVGVASMVRIAAASAASAAATAAAWVGSALSAMGAWLAGVVRTAVTAAAQFVMMAARAVAWAAIMAAQWLIAMGPIGWVIAAVVALVVLIIANWSRIKAATAAAWNWVWNKIKAVAQGIMTGIRVLAQLPGKVGAWFKRMAQIAIYSALRMVVWLQSLPGRAFRAISGLAGKVASVATRAFVFFRARVVSGALSAVRWLSGLAGRVRGALAGAGRWLWNAGRSIVQGLVNGIRNMAGAVGRAVSGVMQKARNLLPFSPAKEGPFSGRGWTLYSGRSMMTGLAEGIGQRQHIVAGAMSRAAQSTADALPGARTSGPPAPAPTMMRGASTAGVVTIRILAEGDEETKRRIRKMVRVDGRGDVQVAFGHN